MIAGCRFLFFFRADIKNKKAIKNCISWNHSTYPSSPKEVLLMLPTSRNIAPKSNAINNARMQAFANVLSKDLLYGFCMRQRLNLKVVIMNLKISATSLFLLYLNS